MGNDTNFLRAEFFQFGIFVLFKELFNVMFSDMESSKTYSASIKLDN